MSEAKNIKVFIDDWRNPASKHEQADEWITIRSYQNFEKLIDWLLEKKEGWITEISFDYDLQDHNYCGSDCMHLMIRTILKYGLPCPEKIYVHSEWPNAEQKFRSGAMHLSNHFDKDIDLIKINENNSHSIVKAFG